MPRRSKVSDAQIRKAAERIARGELQLTIAPELGISPQALGQRLRKLAAADAAKVAPSSPTQHLAPEQTAEQLGDGDEDVDPISPEELRARMTKLIRQLETQAQLPGLNDLERRKIQESLVKAYSAYQRVICRDDDRVLVTSKEALVKRRRELRELFLQRVRSGREVKCQGCGVKLSQSWAREAVDADGGRSA